MNLLSIMDAGASLALLVGLQIAAIVFLVIAYKASRSNSTTQAPNGQTVDNTGNVPITKTGWFVFFVMLQFAAIGTAVIIYLDYK